MSLKIGVYNTPKGKRYVAEGKTYENRDRLKGAGMRWDPGKKEWWTSSEATASIIASASQWIRRGERGATAHLFRTNGIPRGGRFRTGACDECGQWLSDVDGQECWETGMIH